MRISRFVPLLGAAAVLFVGLPGTSEASTAAAPAVRSVVPRSLLTSRGSSLVLDGRTIRVTGVNAYHLASDPSINAGCGPTMTQTKLDAFFASLPRDTLVRFWAFQALATNRTTRKPDFRAIDRVVDAADRHGIKLVATLSDQSGTCDDGHWHDSAWYAGGWRRAYNDDGRGLAPLPFATYVRNVVNRYRSRMSIGMWELVNEPEGSDCAPGYRGSRCGGHTSCPPTATTAMRAFFDQAGAELKRVDGRHLHSSGVLGGTQCGMGGDAYVTLHASPFLDVATFHDYGRDTDPLPAELRTRLTQMSLLGKPLLIEESGIRAAAGALPGCRTPQERAALLTAKWQVAQEAGAAGYLPWAWTGTPNGSCDYDIGDGDPALPALRAVTPRPIGTRAEFREARRAAMLARRTGSPTL